MKSKEDVVGSNILRELRDDLDDDLNLGRRLLIDSSADDERRLVIRSRTIVESDELTLLRDKGEKTLLIPLVKVHGLVEVHIIDDNGRILLIHRGKRSILTNLGAGKRRGNPYNKMGRKKHLDGGIARQEALDDEGAIDGGVEDLSLRGEAAEPGHTLALNMMLSLSLTST